MRIPDGADDAGGQVLAPANVVDHLFRNRVVEHPVNSEVASERILARAAKVHADRVAAIEIGAVSAKGRHLKRIAFKHHQHDAELRPHRHSVGKQRLHVCCPRTGGDIKVLGFDA